MIRRSPFFALILSSAALSSPAFGQERELDTRSPPASAKEIETPIQQVFPEEVRREPLFPWFRQQLQGLPPFFADSTVEARFRTYFLRKDRTIGILSEAWAAGGSLAYRSGWLAELFQVEVEGFTTQPLFAENSRDSTLLLREGQRGFSVLGIANGKLAYKGIQLTGYRQYLDLPYVNRQDNRMVPNTFEAVRLEKPEGELRVSTGYAWRVKLRDSDDFRSFTEALGLDEKRGFAHGGVLWVPNEDFDVGVIGGAVPDLFAGLYSEIDFRRDLADGLEGRLDGQFTYQWEVGEDLLEEVYERTWNLGVRASASYAGIVARLGFVVTGSNGSVLSLFGSNPSYVNLMQRSFTRADEKAALVSLSYDFAGVGVDGLSAIVNFAAGFDADNEQALGNAQTVDVTIDYRIKQGFLKHFYLRLRGSWLNEERTTRDGTDFRAILRYDFPVI